MKKVIIIIVVAIIVIGGGYSIYSYANSKSEAAVVTTTDSINYQNITKSFLYAVETNNYENYKNLCDSTINSNAEFNKIQSAIKNLGDFKNITYIETASQDGVTATIYKGEFSKATNTIQITFNKENKVAEFSILPNAPQKELTEYNKTATTFLTSISTNNYAMYTSVCNDKMGTEKIFSSMENLFKNKLGDFKNIEYITTTTAAGSTVNIYKGTFDKTTINVKVSLDGQDKVEGFFLL
ncbi:MAG: DUF3887 domain-containing protein [Clostridium sp.]